MLWSRYFGSGDSPFEKSRMDKFGFNSAREDLVIP